MRNSKICFEILNEGHTLLIFTLSLSFYISPERASKGLQDGIRIKSVR